jgi:LysM repeat protein
MKKALSIALLLSVIFTATAAPSYAAVDTTTAATSAATTTTKKATTTTKKASATTTVNAAAGTVYTVANGDAFWKIAKKFNLTIDELAKLNPQVKNISKIFVGDKLIVKAAPVAAAPAPVVTTPVVAAKKIYHGFGEAANYRVSKSNLNITTASVVFDENGKILDLEWDVMEITKTLFPGWHDPKADQATNDAFKKSIDGVWETKREEGYAYDMTHKISKGAADNLTKKEWFEQLDFYEAFFKGMTVAEVETWFKTYTDSTNGKPIKMAYPDKLTDAEKAKAANFTDKEKAMLVDVTTSATMSLEDDHSLFITALKEAFAAKKEVK